MFSCLTFFPLFFIQFLSVFLCLISVRVFFPCLVFFSLVLFFPFLACSLKLFVIPRENRRFTSKVLWCMATHLFLVRYVRYYTGLEITNKRYYLHVLKSRSYSKLDGCMAAPLFLAVHITGITQSWRISIHLLTGSRAKVVSVVVDGCTSVPCKVYHNQKANARYSYISQYVLYLIW